jgi:hypothetical protein
MATKPESGVAVRQLRGRDRHAGVDTVFLLDVDNTLLDNDRALQTNFCL